MCPHLLLVAVDMQHLGYCGLLKEDDCSCSAHVATTLRASEEVKERWRNKKKRVGGREGSRKIGVC